MSNQSSLLGAEDERSNGWAWDGHVLSRCVLISETVVLIRCLAR
ncbi:hypothetical protein BDA96_08G135300 [Sorghum bicolor]|uniref:Uncharacterized protein n=2 Tax=Sorghum bicolor TaxID=4558 RepID=A0A921QIH9_SORBI|nr:hypothetical protein BDA96_08G135300 [Sorghum bicolor]OQU79269.1 hypothetical protein SORBI_3008G121850 [Sorghum bicolor]